MDKKCIMMLKTNENISQEYSEFLFFKKKIPSIFSFSIFILHLIYKEKKITPIFDSDSVNVAFAGK